MKDKTGMKFGKLTVIRFLKKITDKNGKARYLYECKCECGNTIIRETGTLRENTMCSCGCYKAGTLNKKHGLWSYDNKLYGVWQTMKGRCFKSTNTKYKNYGGRGISVCDEWKNDFKVFNDWAYKNGYKEGLTLDRIDVNGNYEPSNCRWITAKEQARNKTTSFFIEYNGEKRCLSEWASILNLSYKALFNRLKYKGWSVERAFATAILKKTN